MFKKTKKARQTCKMGTPKLLTCPRERFAQHQPLFPRVAVQWHAPRRRHRPSASPCAPTCRCENIAHLRKIRCSRFQDVALNICEHCVADLRTLFFVANLRTLCCKMVQFCELAQCCKLVQYCKLVQCCKLVLSMAREIARHGEAC
jgi:hypothetical protein